MYTIHLRSDRATIRSPSLSPLFDGGFDRIFLGQVFIDIDTQTGAVVRIHVALPHFGRAREHLVDQLIEPAPLLHATVGCPQIQVQVGGVADR